VKSDNLSQLLTIYLPETSALLSPESRRFVTRVLENPKDINVVILPDAEWKKLL